MKKTLLLLFSLLLTFATVSAQENVLQAPRGAMQKNTTVTTAINANRKAPSKISLADNQQILGPYDNDALASGNNTSGIPNYPGTYLIANFIPVEDVAPFNGGRIVKMRVGFGLGQKITSKFFVRPVDLEGNILDDDVAEASVTNPVAGWNEVEFEEPYTINTENISGLLIGFRYKQVNTKNGSYYSDECYPLSIVGEGTRTYGIRLYGSINNKTAWYNFGTGNLSVQCIVEGDFPAVGAEPQNYGHVVVNQGSQSTKVVTVHNTGTEGLSNIDYTITTDGVASEERHLDLPSTFTHFNGYASIALPFEATTEESTQQRVVNITKVNGKENPSAAVGASGLVASSNRTFTHRVAVEEFTGTGCGWCPRGLVGMENLRSQFGDLFVGVGIHQYNSSDAMYIANYPSLGFEGAPSCMVDRLIETDPYYGQSQVSYAIDQLFSTIQAMAPEIGVEVSGEWNADSTKIVATAQVEGFFDGSRYNVELSLVADSLTGTTTAWKQSNYYYQYSASQLPDDLALFGSGGKYGKSSISGWKFNDVAIATSFTSTGKNNAPAVTINGAEKSISSCTLTLPTKATLKKAILKDQVFVVAIVTDESGKVINSAKYHMPFYVPDPTAIATLQSESSASEARFAIDGRRLDTPQRGLNIIRRSDGTTRKVFVR